MKRGDYLRILMPALGERDVVVTALGSIALDTYRVQDRPGNFYVRHAMGSALLVGVGLAMARPDLNVWVFAGDGSCLMGLSALVTTGVVRPANLTYVLFDNGINESGGGLPTAAANPHVDLCKIAEGAGFATIRHIESPDGLRPVLEESPRLERPLFIHLKVGVGTEGGVLGLIPVCNQQRFQRYVASLQP